MWKYQISAVDINQNHGGLAAFWTTIQPSVNPTLSYKTLQFTNPIALSLSLSLGLAIYPTASEAPCELETKALQPRPTVRYEYDKHEGIQAETRSSAIALW